MHISQFLGKVTIVFDDNSTKELTKEDAILLSQELNAHFARKNREDHISIKTVPNAPAHIPSSHDSYNFDSEYFAEYPVTDGDKPSDS
jgi:hypothetical protein